MSANDGDTQKLSFLAKLNIHPDSQLDEENLYHMAVAWRDNNLIRYLLTSDNLLQREAGLSSKNTFGENVLEYAIQNVSDYGEIDEKKTIIVATILHYLMRDNPALLNKLLSTDSAKKLIYFIGDLVTLPEHAEFFIPLLLDAPPHVPYRSFLYLSHDEAIVTRSISTIVNVIKALSLDNPKRAEYLDKLQDSGSPIVMFLSKVAPETSTSSFFKKQDPVSSILLRLKAAGIEISPSRSPGKGPS